MDAGRNQGASLYGSLIYFYPGHNTSKAYEGGFTTLTVPWRALPHVVKRALITGISFMGQMAITPATIDPFGNMNQNFLQYVRGERISRLMRYIQSESVPGNLLVNLAIGNSSLATTIQANFLTQGTRGSTNWVFNAYWYEQIWPLDPVKTVE